MGALKEHFVTAWTSKCLHLGNINTSRVEGSHAALKRWLKVSTLDLQQLHNKIKEFVTPRKGIANKNC